MCISTLFSLFGCGKGDRFILDGPGMVNTTTWDSFSVSRYGDSMADQNFHITVKYYDDGYVVNGEGPALGVVQDVKLPDKACREIDALKPHLLPDVIASAEQSGTEEVILLDAATTEIEVAYVDGTLHTKADEDDFSMKVYRIVEPYLTEN